jgi:hypothetical protein
MGNENDITPVGEWLDGMPVQTENIGFKAAEMIACSKCGKLNPPNRASCLYCATPIDLPEERKWQAQLNLRPLENWEKGYNIVFVPPADQPDATSISGYLSIDLELLQQMLAATAPFPIARLESEAEALIAVQQLERFGLKASVVSDETLHVDQFPTRLREIKFLDGSMIVRAFNTGEQTEMGRDELVLIVMGCVTESKTETVEKRKKKETKLLQETATAFDESLIDIYSASDHSGFRIPVKGFDFSCLGDEKELLASVNIERLKAALLRFSPQAKLVDEYAAHMNTLSFIWEIERQKDFQGMKRTGFGRSGFANVERTNNLAQFTKYSRLQRHLL